MQHSLKWGAQLSRSWPSCQSGTDISEGNLSTVFVCKLYKVKHKWKQNHKERTIQFGTIAVHARPHLRLWTKPTFNFFLKLQLCCLAGRKVVKRKNHPLQSSVDWADANVWLLFALFNNITISVITVQNFVYRQCQLKAHANKRCHLLITVC